jgi:hypothetical protein
MIVEGFDRKIVFPGHFTDGSQDDRRQAVCLRHVRHRAANATVAVISFQSALAPFIGSGEQLDYLVHLAHALVESEPDTIERHGLPPCQRTPPKKYRRRIPGGRQGEQPMREIGNFLWAFYASAAAARLIVCLTRFNRAG